MPPVPKRKLQPAPKAKTKCHSKVGLATVYCGDCIELVPKLGKYDLIFADPPFNIGQDYMGFNDNIPVNDYWRWVDKWMDALFLAAAPNGVIALHGPDPLVELYLFRARQRAWRRIAWVNWHYRFGQCGRGNWIDSRCHCLVYARGGTHTWNPDAVLVQSDRVKYGDKRVNDSPKGGKRLPFTVWGVESDGPHWGRVTGSSSNGERRPNHPNQLPEKYLERLIRAYTNKGDKVLDPFGGSGTTAVVSNALGRHCDTIEISADSCASINQRLNKGAVRV